MAMIQCQFFSRALGMHSTIQVILPELQQGIGVAGESATSSELAGEKLPVLWLLHGLSDDQSIWMRRTSIERYVVSHRLAVVMPNVHRSFYADMAQGGKYWTYVSEELPTVCQNFFPLSTKREDNFAAGLSMGGYGAFKLGLLCPERYSYVASLSGALDMQQSLAGGDRGPEWEEELGNIFGGLEQFVGADNDLVHQAKQLGTSGRPQPKFYQCCGTDDFLYEQNQSFKNTAETAGLDLIYEEHASRVHSWDYWDERIQDVLNWLPLQANG